MTLGSEGNKGAMRANNWSSVVSCKREEKTTLLREGGRQAGRGCVWCGRKETGESGEWVEVEEWRITVNEKLYMIWNAWKEAGESGELMEMEVGVRWMTLNGKM